MGIVLYILLITALVLALSTMEIKEVEEAQRSLNNKLLNLCFTLNIPVEYRDSLGKVVGRIIFNNDRENKPILDSCKIEILNRFKNTPYVLAHEIGHYIAIKKYQDNSEEMADKMAGELCLNFLSDREREILNTGLEVYFGISNKN